MNLSKDLGPVHCLFEKNWNKEGGARKLNYFKIRFFKKLQCKFISRDAYWFNIIIILVSTT